MSRVRSTQPPRLERHPPCRRQPSGCSCAERSLKAFFEKQKMLLGTFNLPPLFTPPKSYPQHALVLLRARAVMDNFRSSLILHLNGNKLPTSSSALLMAHSLMDNFRSSLILHLNGNKLPAPRTYEKKQSSELF